MESFRELIGNCFYESLGYNLEDLEIFYDKVKTISTDECKLSMNLGSNRMEFRWKYQGNGDFKELKDLIYTTIESNTGLETKCEISFNRGELENREQRYDEPAVLYTRSILLPNSTLSLDISLEDMNR